MQLFVTSPRSMTDLSFLHKSEIDLDHKTFEHHSRVLYFQPCLRKLRTSADNITPSICAIPPHIQVQRDKALVRKQHQLCSLHVTGQNVQYMTLEAPKQSCGVNPKRIL